MRYAIPAVTLVAALLLVTSASARVTLDVPYWQAANHHCRHGYSQPAAKRGIAANLRTHEPLTRQRGRRVWRYANCAPTQQQARSRAHYVRQLRHWRKKYAHVWPIKYNRLPAGDRAWAESTSSCESGMNPKATDPSGIYLGAFQFLLSTWHSAGGTGDPRQHSWFYQAVVAVRWMHGHGAGQWPVCG